MAGSKIEQELKAIKTIADALKALDADSRTRALRYAIEHLGLPAPSVSTSDGSSSSSGDEAERLLASERTLSPTAEGQVIDIRTLKEQKQPSSAIEMATLVAYYLKHKAPNEERKDEIKKADVEKYFVQAGFPLPAQTQFTLPNAKNAGYLETAGHGKYKLNSVGHNLVAHNMPRKTISSPPKARRNKASKKKAPASRKKKR